MLLNNVMCLQKSIFLEIILSKFGGRWRVRQHSEILIPDGMKNYIIAK